MAANRGTPKTPSAVIRAAKQALGTTNAPPKVIKRGTSTGVSPSKARTTKPNTKTVPIKLIGPPRAALRSWGLPGVFRDHMGQPVDETGNRLSVEYLEEMENELAMHVIGKPIDSPAKYLLFVSMYKGFDSDIRQSAAVQAAPYFDKKQPLLQQTQELGPTGMLDADALAKLPKEERIKLLDTLKKLGVQV